MLSDRMECREVRDRHDPFLPAIERLYTRTQHPDEAIPWEWIARSVGSRSYGRPGTRNRHLVLASVESVTPASTPTTTLAGFVYGLYWREYGGYVCYLGVDEQYRKHGVGTALFEYLFQLMQDDSTRAGESLPFVIWESHRPAPGDPEADWKLWEARVKLFDRVGGFWLEGVELQTPNFGRPEAPPVPLQLFLRPMSEPVAAFGTERLRSIVAGLLTSIYKVHPGDPLFAHTLPVSCSPRLAPAREAAKRKGAERRLLMI